MKARRILLTAAAAFALFAFCAAYAPQSGASESYPPPDKRDRCPVCGMFVYKYPDWVAALTFGDGTTLYFDGAKDLFKYYFNIEGDRSRELTGKERLFVTEYYALEVIDARKAFFVAGSDVYGPMGHELIPFVSREDAEAFRESHGGGSAMSFDQVRASDVRALDAR